jgi:hypothetical protein
MNRRLVPPPEDRPSLQATDASVPILIAIICGLGLLISLCGGRLAHARALHRITGVLRSTEAANPAFIYQHCIGLSGQQIAE